MRRDQAGTRQWLPRTPSPRSRSLLFVLPYPGCGPGTYHNWPRMIDDCEVCPVHLRSRAISPGLPGGSLELVAEALAEALRAYAGRPFGLFGHHTSALLAYEVLARLNANDPPSPGELFVSSQSAPGEHMPPRFLRMSRQELAEEMCTLILEMGGIPIPSLVEKYLLLLKSDLRMAERYTPSPPPERTLGVTTIGWESDGDVPPAAMSGWSAYGETSRHVLRGGHHSFLGAPRELLKLLSKRMAPLGRSQRGRR